MTGTIELELRGVGLWTPGFADAAAWASRLSEHVPGDRSGPGAETPRAELLPPMLRRRTSLLTRMAAEVAAQAIAAAGLDRAHVTVIYGSVYGEIRTTLDLLEALLDPAAPLSPTKFHNSVHNTAAGYVSIAAQNRGGNAAITAGRSTLAMGLIECAGLVAAGQGPALLVIAEESLPEPLAAGRIYGPLAAAFALDVPGSGGRFLRTCRLRQAERADHAEHADHADHAVAATGFAPLPEGLRANPCAAALGLIEA
ncbi:MAG: beta-ketoacyl synthase chain length factor, partial [Nannocystis sp.]